MSTRQPPTEEELLALLSDIMPSDYVENLRVTPSWALFRAMAAQFAASGRAVRNTTQSRYFLPSSVQGGPPASSARFATFTAQISRVSGADEALEAIPGSIRIDGPGGRVYGNTGLVVWNPGDTAEQAVEFRALAPGFNGNLDFLAEPDGSISTEYIRFADQDQDRANINGSLVAGAQVQVQDSGAPDVFIAEDVGLYVRLDYTDVGQLSGRQFRIVGFDPTPIEVPVGSGLYPRRVGISLTTRRNMVEVLEAAGGTFVDRWPESVSGDTWSPLPGGGASDGAWFGYTAPFSGLRLELPTPAVHDGVIAWEYWNGATWEPLPSLSDDTDGWTQAPTPEVKVDWQPPTDWEALASPSGSGLDLYFVRAVLDAPATVSTIPKAGRLVALTTDGYDGFGSVGSFVVVGAGGTAVADGTVQANSPALNDTPLFNGTPVAGDFGRLGSATPFVAARFAISTPRPGAAWVLVWEYWNGSAWQLLSNVADGTQEFRVGGTNVVTWDRPSDWEELETSPGVFEYAVRWRLVSGAGSPPAIASQIFLANEFAIGDTHWTLLDWTALGLQLESATAATGGRDDDLFLLGDGRAVYQQDGESDDTFRNRASGLPDVVAPLPILRTINRILAPLGYRGEAIDVSLDDSVGAGYRGLFCDVPPELAPDFLAAFDLYDPADPPLEEPWYLLQSEDDAYRHFLVVLPFLGEGDFGAFADDGPVYYDDVAGVWTGPALGGWLDGYPVDAAGVYSAVYSAVQGIVGGGIRFSMIRDARLNDEITP